MHRVDAEVVSIFKRKKFDDILSRTEISFPTVAPKPINNANELIDNINSVK